MLDGTRRSSPARPRSRSAGRHERRAGDAHARPHAGDASSPCRRSGCAASDRPAAGMKRSKSRIRLCSRSIAWPNSTSTSPLARCWLPINATARRPSSASRACAPTVRCESSASAPAFGSVARKYADAAATTDAREIGSDGSAARSSWSARRGDPSRLADVFEAANVDAGTAVPGEDLHDFIGDAGRGPQAANDLKSVDPVDSAMKIAAFAFGGAASVDGQHADRPRRPAACRFRESGSSASASPASRRGIRGRLMHDFAGALVRALDDGSPAAPPDGAAIDRRARTTGSSSVSAGVNDGRWPN